MFFLYYRNIAVFRKSLRILKLLIQHDFLRILKIQQIGAGKG